MAHDTPPDLRELLPFVLDGQQLRTLADPEPLFSAADLCAMIGHTDPRRAVGDNLDPDEWVKVDLRRHIVAGRADSDSHSGIGGMAHPGYGAQHLTMVTESGAWALIFASQVPGARRVRKWVTSEVLPSIRQRGYYATPTVARELHERLAGFALTADAVLASSRARAERQLSAGVEPTPADRDAELREVRSLVDMAQHARALLSVLQLDGPVAVPEAVLRLAESAGVPVPGGAHGLDPWRR